MLEALTAAKDARHIQNIHKGMTPRSASQKADEQAASDGIGIAATTEPSADDAAPASDAPAEQEAETEEAQAAEP